MHAQKETSERIALFASLFQGLRTVYGTYDPKTGKHWQVKQPVRKSTIYNHLKGIQPYGFYPLVADRTRVGVVDFDDCCPEAAHELVLRARHY